MAKYYTILTNTGAALHANAQITQTTVEWTHLALGDGGGNPVIPQQSQTALVREVHRLPITSIEPHKENPNWIVVEAVVPSSVGGWTVRETAIMGTKGGAKCIAVGNYPETYKPVLAEGAVRELVMRMIVEISSAATVNLVIDPAVAIASREYVDKTVTAAVAAAAPGDATTEKKGLVQLATAAEAQAAKDMGKAVTPAALAACVATESRAGLVMQATAAKVIAGTDSISAVTPAGLSARTATDGRTGLVELATTAEAVAGTDTMRVVTPAGLRAAISAGAPGDASEAAKGVVQLATNAEAQAGKDAGKAVTPEALAACVATESRAGLVMQATAAKVIAGTDPISAVTPAGLSARTATDARTGLVELATPAETVSGADAGRAVTPAGVKAAIKEFDSQELGFTIIYPNGGSAASPAFVSINSRYVTPNPFPGFNVICIAEVLYDGVWGEAGWMFVTGDGGGGRGVKASQSSREGVVTTTGRVHLLTGQQDSGGTHVITTPWSAPLQCRVKVWKSKGVI